MKGMRTLGRYGDEFDRDAAMRSEARVINVSPHVARFAIATTPGSPPRRYRLEPGESVHIQAGYTNEFTGAGRQPVRAIIESLSERHVWAGGPTLPMVVSEDKAEQYSQRWADMIKRGAEPPKPVDVMLPNADGGEPIKMTVQPAAAIARPPETQRASRYDDDEDQTVSTLDEPPPEHNEPLDAVVLPSADKPGKGKRS